MQETQAGSYARGQKSRLATSEFEQRPVESVLPQAGACGAGCLVAVQLFSAVANIGHKFTGGGDVDCQSNWARAELLQTLQRFTDVLLVRFELERSAKGSNSRLGVPGIVPVEIAEPSKEQRVLGI